MKCKKCKCPILVHMKYAKNDKTGEILCEDCFKKMVKDNASV